MKLKTVLITLFCLCFKCLKYLLLKKKNCCDNLNIYTTTSNHMLGWGESLGCITLAKNFQKYTWAIYLKSPFQTCDY